MRRPLKHEREIMDFLRQEFDINDITIKDGGKHAKLHFSYEGKEHIRIVGHRHDHRTIKNVQSELRRSLEPPKPMENLVENLVDKLNSSTAMVLNEKIMEHLPTTPTKTKEARTIWPVKVSAYEGAQVWFLFPKELKQSFSGRYTVERLDDENWRISPGGSTQFRDYHQGNSIKLSYHDTGVAKFRTSLAEAIESDGELLVYLPLKNRVPFSSPIVTQPTSSIILKEETSIVTPTPVENLVSLKTTDAKVEPPSMEERMRTLVRQVREIEALCPYRLVRENGRIFWQAPTIE
jgi:hypothetical protein